MANDLTCHWTPVEVRECTSSSTKGTAETIISTTNYIVSLSHLCPLLIITFINNHPSTFNYNLLPLIMSSTTHNAPASTHNAEASTQNAQAKLSNVADTVTHHPIVQQGSQQVTHQLNLLDREVSVLYQPSIIVHKASLTSHPDSRCFLVSCGCGIGNCGYIVGEIRFLE